MPREPLRRGTEIIKHDFFHPLSIQYHRAGLVIHQDDAMIRVVRADLADFLSELGRAYRVIERMPFPEEIPTAYDEDDKPEEEEYDDEPEDRTPNITERLRHVRVGRNKK